MQQQHKEAVYQIIHDAIRSNKTTTKVIRQQLRKILDPLSVKEEDREPLLDCWLQVMEKEKKKKPKRKMDNIPSKSKKSKKSKKEYEDKIMSCFQEKYDLEKAVTIWNDMVRDGIEPSEQTYLNMFTLYYENSDTKDVRDKAIAFWNDMVTNHGVQPDAQAYGDMIGILWSDDEFKEAIDLWEEMVSRDITGSRDGYCYMISFLGRHKWFDEAERLWEELFKNGMEPRLQVFENLILYYYSERRNASMRDKAITFWTKNWPARVPHAGKALPLMIGIYMEDEEYEGARQLWEEMDRIGMKHTRQSYNYMILYFAEHGDLEKVKQLWKEMHANGFKPDVNTQYLKYLSEIQQTV
jgi:pentatricopeptide repeat protein